MKPRQSFYNIMLLVKSWYLILLLKWLIRYISDYGYVWGVRIFLQHKNYLREKFRSYKKIRYMPDTYQLGAQHNQKLGYEPLISIVVPTFNTPKEFLLEMLKSVIAQTYSNWELCIADGASTNQDTLDILYQYSLHDKRIKIKFLSKNHHISGNTNEAIKLVTGEYIGFLDHDDLLASNCLFEYVIAINKWNKPALLYCDEDKISANSRYFFAPYFKPDFSLHLLRQKNYICHFLMLRSDVLTNIGPLDSKCDGAQDYDVTLRVVDVYSDVVHIPKILYHWRSHQNSVALSSAIAKPYTHEAGKLALAKHFKHNDISADVEDGNLTNSYKASYLFSTNSLISVIITSSISIKNLLQCVSSIYKKTQYLNYEVVIIESIFLSISQNYRRLIKSKFPNLRIISLDFKIANLCEANKYGVLHSRGEYLIFINGNTKIVLTTWIEEMLILAKKFNVGVVTPKLESISNMFDDTGGILWISRSDNDFLPCVMVDRNKSDQVFCSNLELTNVTLGEQLKKHGFIVDYPVFSVLSV